MTPDDYARQTHAPVPDHDSPEAEWGLDARLADDVVAFAGRHGYRVRRLAFTTPEDLSPPVAELHRDVVLGPRVDVERLLVESFVLLDPMLALRTGSVPFWTSFPVQRTVDAVHRYLDGTADYDDIRVTLFSHGVESTGLARPERWEPLLARARRAGAFLGVDTTAFPRDFASMARFNRELRRVPDRFPLPPPTPLEAALETVARHGPAVTVLPHGALS